MKNKKIIQDNEKSTKLTKYFMCHDLLFLCRIDLFLDIISVFFFVFVVVAIYGIYRDNNPKNRGKTPFHKCLKLAINF